MRSSFATCLLLTLILQSGCSMMSKSTARQQVKSNPKEADKFLEAKKLEDQGKFEVAREMYEDLLTRQPEEPVYLHRLGVVCTRLQRYGEANSYYRRARLKDPKNVSLLSDIGYAAYLRGDYVEAEQILREAIQLKPSYKKSSANLALVVGRQGKFDECLELLRTSTGDEARALAALGYIHVQRAEYDLAELRYRAALQIDPELKEASQALADLPKKKSPKDLSIVDGKSTSQDLFEFSDTPVKSAKPSLIQQASSFGEGSESKVESAVFFDDSSDSKPPRKLVDEDEPDWMRQSGASGVTTANRLTFETSQQAAPKLLVETEAEDEFSQPAKLEDNE